MDPEIVALFDMDETLCDHDGALIKDLEKMRGPHELRLSKLHHPLPNYLYNRSKFIRATEDWWANLPKFKLGWDILKVAQKIGFKIMILTQGPKNKPHAWSGKMKWLSKYLPGVDVTMTRDKGLVYGRVLVDDFPPYIERWLKRRPRGLVIMPAHEGNKEFSHPQVIRYDGKNLRVVKKALKEAYSRGRHAAAT
ncbi:hypothetical protein HN747_04450 [archaeon]|jgi:5'-nucleotidase|nr:hypothetical protein [archaeon]